MKILVDIDPETHAAYKALAKERGTPLKNLYTAVLQDAMAADFAVTVGELAARKPRTDKGLTRGPRPPKAQA